MEWALHVGDILDVPADVLVCSANPDLNLSGGVGGAFAVRYGYEMQGALHRHLKDQGLRFAARGTVVAMPACGSPYRAVLHAVAVDAAYETSAEIVAALLGRALEVAADLDARTVAVAALGTGYGRLSMGEFAEALRCVIGRAYPPIERAVIGLRSPHDAEELRAAVPALGVG